MIVSVSAFRHDPHEHALERSSGTGGFALFAQATLPVYEDLNTPEARAAFGLDEQVMRNVSVVGMRVRDGDDASCLNLNRAQAAALAGGPSRRVATATGVRRRMGAARPAAGRRRRAGDRRRSDRAMGAREESRRHARVRGRARKHVPASDRGHDAKLSAARQSHHLREQLHRAIPVGRRAPRPAG